jgi:hypothetical protein
LEEDFWSVLMQALASPTGEERVLKYIFDESHTALSTVLVVGLHLYPADRLVFGLLTPEVRADD